MAKQIDEALFAQASYLAAAVLQGWAQRSDVSIDHMRQAVVDAYSALREARLEIQDDAARREPSMPTGEDPRNDHA
ncbi:hypothetical protein BA022_08105 [Diaphorobacter nitroreducens]|nr:hypothetical protein BA022_08105 [Diaphorobacter nitroreducens]